MHHRKDSKISESYHENSAGGHGSEGKVAVLQHLWSSLSDRIVLEGVVDARYWRCMARPQCGWFAALVWYYVVMSDGWTEAYEILLCSF